MYDKIVIHVNRKYHILLRSITRLALGPTGRVWVYYKDAHDQQKVAVAKQEPKMICHIVNQYQVIYGKKPFILEKK